MCVCVCAQSTDQVITISLHMHVCVTAVSSVTIGFVIRLNKPNYGIDKYGVQ